MSNNENIPSNDQQEPNSEAVPFFVRYLEGQLEELSEQEAESISGGSPCTPETTTPLDQKDRLQDCKDHLKDHLFPMTLKFPSDQEDAGAITTQKFPFDNEDGCGPLDLTRKFPSDSDE